MFSADPASPTGYVSKWLRHTEPGVHETGMLQVLVLARSTRPTLAHCTMPHGHRQVHTCVHGGM